MLRKSRFFKTLTLVLALAGQSSPVTTKSALPNSSRPNSQNAKSSPASAKNKTNPAPTKA